jgi:hypothetical protein
MVVLAQKLAYLYPTANPQFDYRVVSEGGVDSVSLWVEARLGPQPSQSTLDAITEQQVLDAFANRAAQQAKAAATSAIDLGGTLSGSDLYRLIRAEALALMDAINLLRLAIPHPIVSITRSGSVATVTTRVAHGRVAGNPVVISGATLAAYNVSTTVATAPTGTTFTYAVTGTPATPAVGSLSWTEAEVPALLQITAAQVVTAIKAQIAATPE